MSPVPSPSGPQLGSAPTTRAETRRSLSVFFLIAHLPSSLLPLRSDVPHDPDIPRGLLAGIITERLAQQRLAQQRLAQQRLAQQRLACRARVRFGEGRCGETRRGTNRGREIEWRRN